MNSLENETSLFNGHGKFCTFAFSNFFFLISMLWKAKYKFCYNHHKLCCVQKVSLHSCRTLTLSFHLF
jgi:hypothetical protein